MRVTVPSEFPELQRLLDLLGSGWQFGHWYDDGQLTKIVAWHGWPDGSADALRVRYTTDAAGRRIDPHGAVVWEREGTLGDVVDGLLSLPPPDTPGAPRLVKAASTWLWTPGSKR